MVTERLHIRAEDSDDIPALSALVQDMALRVGDIGWDAKARRLALVGNRYRHEAKRPGRVRAALRIDHVLRAERQNWPTESGAILALLAVVVVQSDGGDTIHLTFGGGAALRLTVEVIDISLDDLSGPWGTKNRPKHG